MHKLKSNQKGLIPLLLFVLLVVVGLIVLVYLRVLANN